MLRVGCRACLDRCRGAILIYLRRGGGGRRRSAAAAVTSTVPSPGARPTGPRGFRPTLTAGSWGCRRVRPAARGWELLLDGLRLRLTIAAACKGWEGGREGPGRPEGGGQGGGAWAAHEAAVAAHPSRPGGDFVLHSRAPQGLCAPQQDPSGTLCSTARPLRDFVLQGRVLGTLCPGACADALQRSRAASSHSSRLQPSKHSSTHAWTSRSLVRGGRRCGGNARHMFVGLVAEQHDFESQKAPGGAHCLYKCRQGGAAELTRPACHSGRSTRPRMRLPPLGWAPQFLPLHMRRGHTSLIHIWWATAGPVNLRCSPKGSAAAP